MTKNPSPSQLIDVRIEELGDWRGELLSRLRGLVKQADPDVVEEWKWRGVPVWSHAGMICTGETYKDIVKMTFARGAALEDPRGPLQLQPGWEHAAGHRLPRGRGDRRGGREGSRPRRRDPEHVQSQALIHGTTQRLAAAVASPWAAHVRVGAPHLDTCYWCSIFGSNA